MNQRISVKPETALRVQFCSDKLHISKTAVHELAVNLFYQLYLSGIIQATPGLLPKHLTGSVMLRTTQPLQLNLDALPE